MPFIRYETGDIAEISEEKCECGRGFRVIKIIFGRDGDFLVIGDRNISGSMFLNQLLKKMSNIIEMQICQSEIDAIEIRVLPAKSFSNKDREELRNRVRERLGSQIKLNIVKVNQIDTLLSGKKRYIISELNNT